MQSWPAILRTREYSYHAEIQTELVCLVLLTQLNFVQYRFYSFRLESVPVSTHQLVEHLGSTLQGTLNINEVAIETKHKHSSYTISRIMGLQSINTRWHITLLTTSKAKSVCQHLCHHNVKSHTLSNLSDKLLTQVYLSPTSLELEVIS